MVTDELFDDLQDLYKENIELFKQQNTGLIINKIYPLTIDSVEKILDTDEIVDKKYIHEHYLNFTINPQITEMNVGFTAQVEISPDISWELKK